MTQKNILIVEDEVLIAEHIKDYLISFGWTQIYMAHNKKTALQIIDYLSPEIVLLDIHLAEPLDGLDIARYLDTKKNMHYIFITANSDLLIVKQATETFATAYITKPIKKADLFAAMEISLKSQIQKEETYFFVKENEANIRILLNDILYIEGSGNYIHIYTQEKKIISRQSLENVSDHLPEHQFIRAHRSYIINIHAVKSITSKSVTIGNIEIPVSRTHYSKISDFFKKK